jgi:DNA-binding MarR family transcriptional regulator
VNAPTAERRARRIALAAKIFQSRLDRALFFRSALFSDAAWDALLAIYVFGAAGRTLSAGELCRATAETSPTTALRMQRRLCDLGMVRRAEHPNDRRRILVELTAEGLRSFEEYLDHILDNHMIPLSDKEIAEPPLPGCP